MPISHRSEATLAVNPSVTYNYTITAIDRHNNASTPVTLSATTAYWGAIDSRRVGLPSTGTFWGGAGEQLDMRSGNLNLSVPLLSAKGRGSGFGLGLVYNSQNWMRDGGNTIWRYGRDVGYGFGWRLMLGSLLPVYSDNLTVHHYVLSDSSGAEYRLDVNNSGVWTSSQGTYATYVETTNRIYFNNGSYWQMDALSGGTEDDAGTRYPTKLQDTNGNYVAIRYMAGLNAPAVNTCARISQIEDVRATSNGGATYTFTYNTDAIPHLTGISNSINTAENYSFSYTVPATLYGPFASSPAFGSAQMLQIVTQTGTSLSHTMEYGANGAGELTKVTFPLQGELRWTYTEFTFGGNRTVREVTSRQLVMKAGATPLTYTISHSSGDTSRSTRSDAQLMDAGGVGQKHWWFNTSGTWLMGLVQALHEWDNPNVALLRQTDYTWTTDANGRPYVSAVLRTLDNYLPKQSKTEQTLDIYGNVTQRKEYDYTSLTVPVKTYNYSYLNTAPYLNLYIRNRLTSASVTGSSTVTLASNQYDSTAITGLQYVTRTPTTPQQYDTTYNDDQYTTRGNLTVASAPGRTRYMTYDATGKMLRVQDELGRYSDTTNSQNDDYAAPSAVTPNGDSTKTESYTWNSFLGLTQESGPNGATASVAYDSAARPTTTTSPHGAVTYYTYSNSPPWVTVTTNGHWVKTTSDGFGRPIKVERGDSGGSKSVTDTEYDACGCSPLGKVKRVSQPYAPGGTIYWTTNTYDGLGRTTQVAAPNGTGTTTYSYLGNTVTVTDPAGKWKKYESDAFGNVTKTTEPNPGGGANLDTTYGYNIMSQMTTLTMTRGTVTQTRTWTYEAGTQRLLSETVPESGTTSYLYNASGQVTKKTNASGSYVNYTYDGFGRVLTVTDSANPACSNANYFYDHPYLNAIGRLWRIEWGGGLSCAATGFVLGEQYQYSPGGLITAKAAFARDQQAPPVYSTLWLYYAYDNEGLMTTMVTPNATYNYSYDGLGRLAGMTGTAAVSGVTYNAAGQILTMNHDGLAETRTYNERLQLTRMTIPGQMDLEYRFSATQNNGQITSMKNWINSEEVNYTYDALGRLSTAVTTGTEWGLSFTHDGFGNKTAQTVTKGSAPSMSIGVDSTNHVVGHTYDANGNTTSLPGINSLTWDAQGRMMTAAVSSQADAFSYNASNQRVLRLAAGASTSQFFLRGIDGRVLSVYSFNSSSMTFTFQQRFSYFAGKRVGVKEDRLSTVQNGSRYYPYGEESPSTAQDKDKFATYWRDGNTGFDYAINRYYTSALGRFLSPDKYFGSGGANMSSSWNKYSYAGGDPINFNDPSGQMRCWVTSWNWDNTGSRAFVMCFSNDNNSYREGVVLGIRVSPNSSEEQFGKEELRIRQDLAYLWRDLDPVSDWDLMPFAVNVAVNALTTYEGCRNLYGNATTRAGKWNPVDVLQNIFTYNQTAFVSSVNFELTNGSAETIPPKIGRPSLSQGIKSRGKPTIRLNRLYWNLADPIENAETLLHELAHVYNFAVGSGDFSIPNSAEGPFLLGGGGDPYAFDKVIRPACFPQQ